jgi:4-amino-4-deoxy-L-arabinose transferase-like glycosyltransferase
VLAAAAPLPFCLIAGSLMQYVSFDYLFWTATAYFVVRLIKSGDHRWWLAIGATIGLGMLTKYTMGVLALSVAAGVFLTPLRGHLKSKWLWAGVALSLLVFLPNAIWQVQHDFISHDFLRHIHERDVRIGRTRDFFPDQIKLNLLALPLAVAGLWYAFKEKRWRIFGWMFVFELGILAAAKGRGYYLAGAYPPLFAAGAAWLSLKSAQWKSLPRTAMASLCTLAVAANVFVACMVLAIAPVGSGWFKRALAMNGDLAEEFGWQELAATVARVRDELPENEREQLGILAGNYGEAGAINLFGPQHGLPPAISGTNSFWLRGYGDPAPQTLIVLGLDREFLESHFEECRAAAQQANSAGVENEETRDHPDIYVCGPPKRGWEEFWRGFRRFG